MIKASAQRALSLLISAVLIIGSFVVYGVLIKPAYQEANVLRGTMYAKQHLFEQKKAAVGAVESLIKAYQGAGRLQDTIALSLPSGQEVSSLFNQLQTIAAANGLEVQVFNVQILPLKPSTDNSLAQPLGTVRVSLRMAGSYESFKNGIAGLETNIRVMDIVSIKIEPAGRGLNTFSYAVVLDTYYQGK